jgi:hypothetical protein
MIESTGHWTSSCIDRLLITVPKLLLDSGDGLARLISAALTASTRRFFRGPPSGDAPPVYAYQTSERQSGPIRPSPKAAAIRPTERLAARNT